MIKIVNLGRLGNCIIRVINCLHIGLHLNCNIILPEHPFINTKKIIINENKSSNHDNYITDKHCFYFRDKINIDRTIFINNNDKVLTILKNAFKFKKFENTSHITDRDLVIHIRSGDIFDNYNYWYQQPPLSYYVQIINIYEHNIDNIYIVAEDKKNPCIDKLLKLYPSIIYNKNSLEEDIKIILSATTIVGGFGSFIPSLSLFSTKLKTLYIPSNVFSHVYHTIIFNYNLDFDINIVDIDDFIKKINKLPLKESPRLSFMCDYNKYDNYITQYKVNGLKQIKYKRCSREIWNINGITLSEALEKSKSDPNVKALHWYNKNGGDGRVDGIKGWYQGAGGDIGKIKNDSWDTILI